MKTYERECKVTETVYRVEIVKSGEVTYTRQEQDSVEINYDVINVREVSISNVPPYGVQQLLEEGNYE